MGGGDERHVTSSLLVREEILEFFRANPFLLVGEGRLATLLCRPSDLVGEAVRSLERDGLLERREGDILVGLAQTEETLPR